VYEERQSAGEVDPVRPMPALYRQLCFVVDDDAGICKALSFTLRKLGLGSAELGGPQALVAALEERKPSLVFLDLSLGDFGALDVLPILAEHAYRGPVQLMSGRGGDSIEEVVAAGERQGLAMLPPLTKPFRMGVIRELIANLGLAGAS